VHRLRKLHLEGAARDVVLLKKPARGGKEDKNSSAGPMEYMFPPEPVRESGLKCGANPLITSASKRERCPAECPLHVENRFNEPVCDFHCVENTYEACAALDPKADVPDLERGFCRSCIVQGCKECTHDGSDHCARCRVGHRLTKDGLCENELFWIWYVVFGTLGFVLLIVVAWVVDIGYRPLTNLPVLNRALRLRSRAKLRQPKIQLQDQRGDPDQAEINRHSRQLWPLNTNLCTTVVGGPSLLLAFRFQVFVIAWGLLLGLGWLVLGLAVDTELFVMGTRRYDSPRQQCMVIQWGYETQHRLLWTKVLFCVGAYLLTFVGALIFGIFQLRAYQHMDMQHSTHKDFTIFVEGLVGLTGKAPLEEELKTFFEEKTGQKVECVSVGWGWEEERRDRLMEVIEEDLVDLATERRAKIKAIKAQDSSETEIEDQPDQPDSARGASGFKQAYRATMQKVEALFLTRPVQKALTRGRSKGISQRHTMKKKRGEDQPRRRSCQGRAETLQSERAETLQSEGGDEEPDSVKSLLEGLKTNGKAFVVFRQESIRDQVVKQFKDKDLQFKGKSLTIHAAHCEPDSVKWESFTDPELAENSLVNRFGIGLKWVGAGLMVWTCVFYAPFCWVSMSHNYHHGQEPPAIETITFSMVVCIGNVIMYTVCSEATDRMKFNYVKDHEIAYMFFYLSACMINVVLDLVITFAIAYWHLKGLDTRTYFGETLDEVPTTASLLMTYGMQRELADNLLAYSFPGTFLLPFVFEPIAAIYLPYKLMVLLVRSHTEIKTTAAEAYLASIPFDLSRYADIHLNVILAALVLIFPGGYNLVMFFGLAVSHVWIYIYDHFRVLRASPSFDIVNLDTDWWAQWMFCLPAGIILSSLAFKYNQMVDYELTKSIFGNRLGDPHESNWGVALLCAGLFFIHIAVHTLMLAKVVPLFGAKEREADEYEEYKFCAKRLPHSWITSNPVYCLRSHYYYEHDVPVTFCMPGKEHLMQENTKLGQYFVDDKVEAEDYSVTFSRQSWMSESRTTLAAEATPTAK